MLFLSVECKDFIIEQSGNTKLGKDTMKIVCIGYRILINNISAFTVQFYSL